MWLFSKKSAQPNAVPKAEQSAAALPKGAPKAAPKATPSGKALPKSGRRAGGSSGLPPDADNSMIEHSANTQVGTYSSSQRSQATIQEVQLLLTRLSEEFFPQMTEIMANNEFNEDLGCMLGMYSDEALSTIESLKSNADVCMTHDRFDLVEGISNAVSEYEELQVRVQSWKHTRGAMLRLESTASCPSHPSPSHSQTSHVALGPIISSNHASPRRTQASGSTLDEVEQCEVEPTRVEQHLSSTLAAAEAQTFARNSGAIETAEADSPTQTALATERNDEAELEGSSASSHASPLAVPTPRGGIAGAGTHGRDLFPSGLDLTSIGSQGFNCNPPDLTRHSSGAINIAHTSSSDSSVSCSSHCSSPSAQNVVNRDMRGMTQPHTSLECVVDMRETMSREASKEQGTVHRSHEIRATLTRLRERIDRLNADPRWSIGSTASEDFILILDKFFEETESDVKQLQSDAKACSALGSLDLVEDISSIVFEYQELRIRAECWQQQPSSPPHFQAEEAAEDSEGVDEDVPDANLQVAFAQHSFAITAGPAEDQMVVNAIGPQVTCSRSFVERWASFAAAIVCLDYRHRLHQAAEIWYASATEVRTIVDWEPSRERSSSSASNVPCAQRKCELNTGASSDGAGLWSETCLDAAQRKQDDVVEALAATAAERERLQPQLEEQRDQEIEEQHGSVPEEQQQQQRQQPQLRNGMVTSAAEFYTVPEADADDVAVHNLANDTFALQEGSSSYHLEVSQASEIPIDGPNTNMVKPKLVLVQEDKAACHSPSSQAWSSVDVSAWPPVQAAPQASMGGSWGSCDCTQVGFAEPFGWPCAPTGGGDMHAANRWDYFPSERSEVWHTNAKADRETGEDEPSSECLISVAREILAGVPQNQQDMAAKRLRDQTASSNLSWPFGGKHTIISDVRVENETAACQPATWEEWPGAPWSCAPAAELLTRPSSTIVKGQETHIRIGTQPEDGHANAAEEPANAKPVSSSTRRAKCQVGIVVQDNKPVRCVEDIAARYVQRREEKRHAKEQARQREKMERKGLRTKDVAPSRSNDLSSWPSVVLAASAPIPTPPLAAGPSLAIADRKSLDSQAGHSWPVLGMFAIPADFGATQTAGVARGGPRSMTDLCAHVSVAQKSSVQNSCSGDPQVGLAPRSARLSPLHKSRRATLRICRPFAEVADDLEGFSAKFAQAAAQAAGVPVRRIRVLGVRPAGALPTLEPDK